MTCPHGAEAGRCPFCRTGTEPRELRRYEPQPHRHPSALWQPGRWSRILASRTPQETR